MDTVSLAMQIKDLPFSEAEFARQKWTKRFKSKGKYGWVFKERYQTGFPFLYFHPVIKKRIAKQIYLVVEVSLPAFANGDNAKLLTEEEVRQSLQKLSDYVTKVTKIKFNAEEAVVWKIHFAQDIFVGEGNIAGVLDRIARIGFPYFKVERFYNSTVNLNNRGKSKSLIIYDKATQTIDKHFSKESQDIAKGMIRIELKFNTTRSVQGLARKLSLKNCRAKTLLTTLVLENALRKFLDEICKQLRGQTIPDRINLLINTFGATQARKYLAFLVIKDNFGSNFQKISTLGYSRSNYYNLTRELSRIGILTLKK